MSGQRPTAQELVAAVRGFLEQEVAGQLTGATAFNLRIAVNVLAIVERDWLRRMTARLRRRASAPLGRKSGAGA